MARHLSRVPGILAAGLLLAGGSPLAAQTAPNACSFLTSAEVARLITRGQKNYGETPTATAMAGGAASICDYPTGGQTGIWVGPKSEANLEAFLKGWKADKHPRRAVSGVGDRAWIMFPAPRNQYEDRVAYLMARVGDNTVTAVLIAYDGAADGPMGAVCRNPSQLKPDEREDCKKILADKSETQESLEPAVVELAKVLVANVRAKAGR